MQRGSADCTKTVVDVQAMRREGIYYPRQPSAFSPFPVSWPESGSKGREAAQVILSLKSSSQWMLWTRNCNYPKDVWNADGLEENMGLLRGEAIFLTKIQPTSSVASLTGSQAVRLES